MNELMIEAHHEVNGTRTDLGKFFYSIVGNQRAIVNYKYDSINTESETEQNDQNLIPYVYSAIDRRIVRIVFIIQETQKDFFESLIYHSHVYITDENGYKVRVYNVACEIEESAAFGKYLCFMPVTTSEDIIHLTGDEL